MTMGRMQCSACGHIYDPKKGNAEIAQGTEFEDVKDARADPVYGAQKSGFVRVI
jgi:rubredoxin